jgi:IS5 family transposase
MLPTIEGNVDYRDFRDQLERIEFLLIHSGVETQFIQSSLQDWLVKAQSEGSSTSTKAQLRFQVRTQRALRCNIARSLLNNEDFRGFAMRLADSPLLQSFCLVSHLGMIKVPSKSELERFSKWIPEAKVRELVAQLTRQGHQEPQKLNLEQPLDLDTYFLDTTCVQANIHYPVDWVLLRDATRTLMKSVLLIREQGLKHRMEAPEIFIRNMNRLCIEMTHAWAKADSQKQRKKVLRKMDKLVGVVRGHAKRYRDLLDQQWEQTTWKRGKVDQVLQRLDQVLEQLPAARRQARQRILQGQMPENKDKILSLYDPDVQVIVRRKAGAEVEFGNTLLLGESPQGLILDWELFAESAPADSRLLAPSLERTEKALRIKIKTMGADRGFDSQSNQTKLEKRETFNGVCPRSPQQMKERMGSWKFKKLQRRRSQTEARIAIFKNNILGNPLRSKGIEHRQLAVAWAVLVHNLWVIARLPEKAQESEQAAA